LLSFELLVPGDSRGFQATETEIQPRTVKQGARQGNRLGVTVYRQLGQGRSAGVRKAKHLGGLVEGLPGRVIDRASQQGVLT